jgi:serine/threonine-protein kinase
VNPERRTEDRLTTDRWSEVVALFEHALDHSPEERETVVRRAAGADADLRDRVLAMLQADARPSALLDSGPGTLAADPVADRQPSLEGRTIGAYRILHEIGRGGMGTVWLAEREDVGKRVALKLVSGWLASPERAARFLFERRVLARLEHPNIAKLLDAGVADDGTPWLAMEFIDGRPIDAHCAEHGIDVRGRLELFTTVCDTVAYAHRNLVVHRDLKPSNILVTADGDLRLVDFGIAKLLAGGDTDTDPLTRVGAAPLTPDYASPEQVRGTPITTASDVYQLGVLLYELLAGRRPRDLAGLSPNELAHALENENVTAPSRLVAADSRRSVQGDLDNIVRKAMRTEPDRRYESARALGEDVRRHLAGQPVLARPGTFGYRAAKFVRRHRVGTAMAAGMAAVVVVSAIALAFQARRIGIERDRAEQVSSILADLFSSANQEATRGDTITVRSVLDRGADRVRSDLTADPRVRVRVLGTIANAYRSLGAQDRAVELHADLVATLRASVAANDAELIEALRVEAAWRIETGDVANAVPLLDEALSLLPAGSRRRYERARLLHVYGFAYQVGGDAARARPLYEEAVATFRAGPDSLGSLLESSLVNLAFVAENTGDLEAADSLLREVVDRRIARLGRNDPQTASAMASLAKIAILRGDLDEAEQYASEALAVMRTIYTEPNPRLADALQQRARVHAARGEPAQAESTQREAIDVFRFIFGDDHRAVVLATAELANLLHSQGRLDEAATLFNDAIALYSRVLGERHVTTAITMTSLGYTELARGRVDEAIRLYGLAVPVLDSAWTATGGIAQVLVDYGLALSAGGQCATAEPLLRRALAIESGRWPAGHVRVIRTERTLGTCLVNLRRFDDAEPLLLEAHRKLVAIEGPTGTYAVGAARDLATLYDLWGRPADAARFRVQR